MTDETARLWRRSPLVQWEDLDDGVVIFHPLTQHAISLNETASALWRLLDGDHDLAAIVAELADRYSVTPDEIRPAIERTVDQLADEGAIERG
ncbi:MAG: PqqD family protein [Acidothermus sp.]|nr:PqqD family protein [Acidothermus sp.]